VATLLARRRRQHPIDFGRSSTFVESIDHPQVEELAWRFLSSFDYSGVVEVEFKYDAREDRYKLLDVNGRFWTWCGLGGLAGIDFPYLAYRQALGETIAPCRARPGVAWLHASRDIIAACQEISGGSLRLRDYLASFRQPLTFANFALDDPLPALAEFPAAVLNRIGRGMRGAPSKGFRKTIRERLAK
jgi:D-aspartate ligase